MIDWYDRQGRRISTERANELLVDLDYRRVALDEIGPYEVSTVWLGLDHGWSGGAAPVIFETMVFTSAAWNDPDGGVGPDLDCRRYSTEAEALAGHAATVLLISATLIDFDAVERDVESSESIAQSETLQAVDEPDDTSAVDDPRSD